MLAPQDPCTASAGCKQRAKWCRQSVFGSQRSDFGRIIREFERHASPSVVLGSKRQTLLREGIPASASGCGTTSICAVEFSRAAFSFLFFFFFWFSLDFTPRQQTTAVRIRWRRGGKMKTCKLFRKEDFKKTKTATCSV